MHIKVEACAEKILPQQAIGMGLLNGHLQPLHRNGILCPNINISLTGANGIAANGHGFDDGMRVALQQRTIHECARIAFISVAGNVLLICLALIAEEPLFARGETAAATTPQSGVDDLLNHLFPGHFRQSFGKGLIAVKGDVLFNVFRVNYAAVPQGNTLLLPIETDFVQCHINAGFMGHMIHVHQVLYLAPLQQVFRHNFVHVLYLDAAVEGAFRVHDDYRAGFTEAEAPGVHNFDFLVQSLFFNLFFKALNQLLGAGRRTPGTAADQHMCAKKIHGCSSSPCMLFYAFSCHASTGCPPIMCSSTMRVTMSGVTFT